jgi:hypothetical protein
MARYKVVEESLSAHCCFSYTVVDTANPNAGLEDSKHKHATICECFEEEDAILVCSALNAYWDGAKF